MARFQSGTEIRDVVLLRDDEDGRRDYCERQLELLAGGWRRVRDPAREIDYVDDDPRDPVLEHALHADPDDDQTWLVYADRYIDRGHPRGALIALESAPVLNVVQRAQREAESRALRLAAMDALAGPLAGRSGLNLRWRRGFIHQALLHGEFLRGAAEDLLFDLLRHPSARFLRELRVACSHEDAQDHRLLLGLLLHADPAPPLRTLDVSYDPVQWTGYPPLGDVGALGTRYPLLESVALDGDDTSRFSGLALPRTKRFAFMTSAMPPHTLRAIGVAPWPVLEHLALSFHRSTCTLAELAFIYQLPKLTRLEIRSAPFGEELAHQLLASPLAKQLVRIELRDCALAEDTRDLLEPYDPHYRYY